MPNIPELLAPAGSMACVRAAVAGGCDAVYFGGRSFSARSLAENFDDRALAEAIDYCHLRGVKVYITVNTLYLADELPAVFRFMDNMYRAGADAFIIQDAGTAAEARRLFPDIKLHASTQMTSNTLEDVLALADLGFDRVVLNRELSLEEIKHITDNAPIEAETFVHGALCVSYSGRCLMSSFIGKRSGNRGRCAQPCRKKYTLLKGGVPAAEGYLLSPKDLSSLPYLGEVIASGTACLKIEGRMKNPEYVAQVTRAYRDALDKLAAGENAAPDADTLRRVAQVFNRGGFTEGYAKHYAGADMMSHLAPKPIGTRIGRVVGVDKKRGFIRVFTERDLTPGDGIEVWTKEEPHAGASVSRAAAAGSVAEIAVTGAIANNDPVYLSYDKKLADELKTVHERDTRKINLTGGITARPGEPMRLRLAYEAMGITAEAEGAVPEAAQKLPMDEAAFAERLSKTGGTPFTVTFADNNIADGLFVQAAALNELRRAATDDMADKIVKHYKRAPGERLRLAKPKRYETGEKLLTALVRNPAQFNGVANSDHVARVYVEVTGDFMTSLVKYVKVCKARELSLFAALPAFPGADFAETLHTLEASGIDGYLVRSHGVLRMLAASQKEIALDDTFQIANPLTYALLADEAVSVALSPEIGFDAVNAWADERAEITIHGRPVLMTTRQCPVGSFAGGRADGRFCRLKGRLAAYSLQDATGVSFPVLQNCEECFAYICNDRPVFLLNKAKDILACAAGHIRLAFTTETANEAYDICEAYAAALSGETTAAVRALTQRAKDEGFTYGYAFTGFDEENRTTPARSATPPREGNER